jgi:hypothetical protein
MPIGARQAAEVLEAIIIALMTAQAGLGEAARLKYVETE